jgi:hypothetical protein
MSHQPSIYANVRCCTACTCNLAHYSIHSAFPSGHMHPSLLHGEGADLNPPHCFKCFNRHCISHAISASFLWGNNVGWDPEFEGGGGGTAPQCMFGVGGTLLSGGRGHMGVGWGHTPQWGTPQWGGGTCTPQWCFTMIRMTVHIICACDRMWCFPGSVKGSSAATSQISTSVAKCVYC